MWRVYILAGLIIFGIAGYIFYDLNGFITNSVTIIGWLLFLIQTMYATIPQIKLFIARLKIYIVNPTINWSFSVIHRFNDLENQMKIDVFKMIEDFLITQENFKIEKRNKSTALYTIRGYMIRVIIREEENIVLLEIGDKDISYRETLKILERISGELEQLYILLKSDEQEYYINMKIENMNPFKGILINNISAIDLESFRVQFSNSSGNIDIYNNSIELYAASVSNIIKLSKKYLHISEKK